MGQNKYKPSMFLLYTSPFMKEVREDTWSHDIMALLEGILEYHRESNLTKISIDNTLKFLDDLIESLDDYQRNNYVVCRN